MNSTHSNVSVMKIRHLLLVSMPPDPDDSTVPALQRDVLAGMECWKFG